MLAKSLAKRNKLTPGRVWKGPGVGFAQHMEIDAALCFITDASREDLAAHE
jgi:hypothetical protein